MSLIRIVRMTFHQDKVEDFVEIFNESKNKIRAYPGCLELQLHQDLHEKNVFITYSRWEDEQALLNYRTSELFGMVWPLTKALFKKPAFAFSNIKIEVVEKSV